jgi:hypothetical protein
MKKSLPELGFFMACINLEKNSADEDETRTAIAMLYDKAISADDKNEGLYTPRKMLMKTISVPLPNAERIFFTLPE